MRAVYKDSKDEEVREQLGPEHPRRGCIGFAESTDRDHAARPARLDGDRAIRVQKHIIQQYLGQLQSQ